MNVLQNCSKKKERSQVASYQPPPFNSCIGATARLCNRRMRSKANLPTVNVSSPDVCTGAPPPGPGTIAASETLNDLSLIWAWNRMRKSAIFYQIILRIVRKGLPSHSYTAKRFVWIASRLTTYLVSWSLAMYSITRNDCLLVNCAKFLKLQLNPNHFF